MFKKVILGAAAVCVALLGAIGFAHTAPGRPLLRVLGPMLGMGHAHGGSGACPFGFDVAASPADKEAARARFAARHRGEGAPAARPALGFKLDHTSRAEVEAWAARSGLACHAPRVGAELVCADVPAAALPAAASGAAPLIEELWFSFGGQGALTSLVAIRKEKRPEPIEAAFRAAEAFLSREAGPPAQASGDASSAALAAGLLRQASVEYRFRDYYAQARASNMGDGFLLTEEYRSLPN